MQTRRIMENNDVYIVFGKVDPDRTWESVDNRVYFTEDPAVVALVLQKGMRIFKLRPEDEVSKVSLTVWSDGEENAEQVVD